MKFLSMQDNFEEILPEIPIPLTGFSLSENYQKIKNIFETREELPDYESLYSEICTCLTLGLNQASITLTSHLLEKSLLFALIYNEAFKNKENKAHLNFNDFFVDEIEKFNKFTLEQKVNNCSDKQLITEGQRDLLHEYRVNIRNGFSHSNLKKIFGDQTVDAKLVSFKDDEIKMEELKLELGKSLFTQGLTQAILSKKIASTYFIFVDGIIRQMDNIISVK